MKRIVVTVVKNQTNNIHEIFKKLELSYAFSKIKIEKQECEEFSSLIPDNLVDTAIEEIIKGLDLRLKENTISVYNIEAHISSYVDRLKEKILQENPPVNPFERLVENAEKFVNINKNILMMALFATLIALAGLFLDNSVTVIGAMLLSPLLGPINAFAINASIGKVKKLIKTEISIIVLLISVIIISAIITAFISLFLDLSISSQIAIRGQSSFVDIGIGLVLGLAGGLALVTAIPEMLVGVGVASALLPPAAVSGIGLGLMNSGLFFGALLLMLVYLVGLELGCTIMLRLKGIQPRRFYQQAEAKKHSVYFIATFSALLVILLVIVLVGNS